MEPLGVFPLDPATNHGSYHKTNLICSTTRSDLIAVSSVINSYASDKVGGGKMKVCTHGDQGRIQFPEMALFMNYFQTLQM